MYMIYYARFSVFLAVGVTCLGLADNSFSFTYRGRNYSPIMSVAVAETIETNSQIQSQQISQTNQANSSVLLSTLTAEGLKYENYMQAGYQADKKRDYLTALENFKSALAIRPEDSSAQKALRNVTSYAFDSLMQAGYQADKLREYQAALQYFRKAQDIKPDSFYAQQAIRNVTNYLATVSNPNTESNEPSSDSDLGLWLMLVALSFAISVAGGILYLLFKGSRDDAGDRAEEPLSVDGEDEAKTTNAPIQTYPQVVQSPSQESDSNIISATTHNVIKEEQKTQIFTTETNNGDHVIKGEQKTQIFTTETNGGHLQPIEQPANRKPQSYFLSSSPSQISKLDIIPELISDLQQSDRNLRRKTIWELAQRADSRAMKPLVELMVKVDSQERSLILEAMTQIASRTLKPMNKALSLSLEDENSQVRQNAIRDLTRVYELMSQVTKRLSQAVEDSDEEVQQTAKWALKQLNQMPNIPWNNHTDL